MKTRNKRYLILILILLVLMIWLSFLRLSIGRSDDSLKADEIYMVNLINRERIKRNLPSLKIDSTLVQIARNHALEMLKLDYFDHESPILGSLDDRLSTLKGWLSAGENLAQASDAESAFKGLMKSKLHRLNILNPNFSHIGIGIVNKGFYGEIFTQNFAQYKKIRKDE